MRKMAMCVVMLGSMLCSDVLADQVSLKNGDRLSGVIIKYDGENLVLKSEFAGEVKIQWAAVERITSDRLFYVTSKDGRVLVGTVTTAEGVVEVQTSDAGKVALTKDTVLLIRSKEEQAAYEAEMARKLQAVWSGSADAGLSAARGNTDTLVISLGSQVARTTQRDKLSLYAASLFARNGTSGVSITTAEAIRGGARYDRNISDRLFVFALTDLERDKFQQLDLRLVFGGGLGYHARRTEKMRLDLFAGGSYNREKFSTGLTRNSAEALVGEELSCKLSENTTLAQRAVLYPNLSEFGEYRFAFDLTGVTKLTRQLGLQATVSDRFQSNPLPGIKKNDLLLTTGIRVTFGDGSKE
ncbi:MAG: YdiY family protein [Pyrinomonadaceae bacterium]